MEEEGRKREELDPSNSQINYFMDFLSFVAPSRTQTEAHARQ